MQKFGLILSAIGSLMAAFAVGKPKGGGMSWSSSNKNGKSQQSHVVAMNYPNCYKYGLILVAVGTILQLF